jgi:ankyrin repeat protein
LRAAGAGHTDCVRLLLEAGADKDAKNEVWHTNLLTMRSCRVQLILLNDRCQLFLLISSVIGALLFMFVCAQLVAFLNFVCLLSSFDYLNLSFKAFAAI